MISKNLSFKVYIEGVDIPFNECTINTSANSPSTASINLVPSNGAFKLRPRSLIHIFYLDDFEGNREWRLLWEGELVGIGYSQVASGQRSAVAQCVDLSGYWAHTKQYFLDSADFGEGGRVQAFLGINQLEVVLDGKLSSYYLRYFSPDVSIIDSVLGMLRDFTTKLVYYQDLNSRLKINEKLDAAPDKAIGKLLNAATSEDMIDQALGHLGGQASILDVVNSIKSIIFYSHVNVGPPVFSSATEEVSVKTFGTSPVAGSLPDDINAKTERKETGSTPFFRSNFYRSFLFKPSTHFTLPPMCNVLFPDVISAINYSRSFINEPTRLKLRGQPFQTLGAQGTVTSQPLYFAPPELGKRIDESGGVKPKEADAASFSGRLPDDIGTGNAPKAFKPQFFVITEEEMEKGMLDVSTPLPFSRFCSTATAEGDQHTNIMQVAQYMYQLMKYESRQISVTGDFNPHVVADFPALILSNPRSYMCNITSIIHYISASSGSTTSITGSHTMELDPDNIADLPELPPWISESYIPEATEETYKKYLGCGSLKRLGGQTQNSGNSDVALSVVSGKDLSGKALLSGAEQIQAVADNIKVVTSAFPALSLLSGALSGASKALKAEGLSRTRKVYNFAKIVNSIYALNKQDQGSVDSAEWDLEGDKYAYADKYRRREGIATMQQVFGQHYNLSPVAGSESADGSAADWVKTTPTSAQNLSALGSGALAAAGSLLFNFGKENPAASFRSAKNKSINASSTIGGPFDYSQTVSKVIKTPKIITGPNHKKKLAQEYKEELSQLVVRG